MRAALPVEIPLTSLRNGRTIPHIVSILGAGAIQTSLIVVRLLGATTMEVLRDIGPTLVFSTAPGACGGVGLFLFSLRAGHYKNNRYVSKLIIELVGAMLVASFVGPLFPEKVVVFASFATGLSWATVIQVARSKITKVVKAAIGEEIR
jgi:hypothetical protein